MFLLVDSPEIICCLIEYDLLILGAKDTGGKIIFNPSHKQLLEVGMTLIVMGKVDNIAKARNILKKKN